MIKTRNILPGIVQFCDRNRDWLFRLREKRKIRPIKVRKALRTSAPKRKRKAPLLTKAQTERLEMLTPEMRKMMGL